MTIFDRLFVGDKSLFDIPVIEQKNYLKKLGDAKSDFDRSYKQYKGQLFFMSTKKKIFLSLLSAVSAPFIVLYLIVKGLFLKRDKEYDAISRATDDHQFVVNTLLEKYDINRTCWEQDAAAIQISDIGYVLHVFLSYWHSPYLALKTVYKVAKYSALIYKHRPSAIIVNDEFSFTSSVLTDFCCKHSILHINVMHGEKLFSLRDSYFRFDKCYIWDEHYRKLFVSLNAESTQFVVELPESMKFDMKDHFFQDLYSDFKYYLGVYSEDELLSVINAMKYVKKKGYTVKYRPHPNYSDRELLKKHLPDEEIESPEVNILESISSTRNVVGVYSTVLTQAYFNGQQVVIDDIAFKNQYEALRDLGYILIDKVDNRLSAYQTA